MHKRFSIRHDLGLQLLMFYVLFVAPVILAALLFDYFTGNRLEADIKANDLALARAISQETNNTLQNALLTIEELGSYEEVINADPESMERIFNTILDARPEFNLVYRLDSAGQMVFHAPVGPVSTVGTDFSFRDYFQQALNSQDSLVSKGRISPTTGQPVATVVMPLWDNQENFLGLVGANLKLQSLSHTLGSITAQFPANEQFEIMIVDSTGQVIAHTDPGRLLTDAYALFPGVAQALDTRQSGNQIFPVQGNDMLLSYVPIFSVNWGVIVQRPAAMAFATPRAVHNGAILTMAVFLLIGLLFWLALSRRVIRPLEELANFSQKIGVDEELTPEQSLKIQNLAGRTDQMGHLIHSLTRMERDIQARLNELTTLLETSAAVVSSLDTQTVLNRILEQAERLLKAPKTAIVALDEQHGVFRATASRGLSKRYATQLSIHPSEPLSVTLRAIRTGQPVQIVDTESDPSFAAMRPRARSEGYRSILAVPLKTQHAPPAALLVYFSEPHDFTRQEINLASQFANQAAMAIENATLYARSDMQLQEQTRRLEALILSLKDGLILEDLSGQVLYANRRMGDLVGMETQKMVGEASTKLLEHFFRLADLPEDDRHLVMNALDGRGRRQAEVKFYIDGQSRYLFLQVFAVTDANQVPLGRGQIWRDITADREVDELKSNLIATVSHELRTPLAAIKGYASTLLADDVEWDALTQREFISIISQETDRLSRLVTDLLDLSQIEAGSLQMNQNVTQLDDLVERAAYQVLKEDQHRLVHNYSEKLPDLWVDPQRVEVVLRNLLENAVKYSPADTKITVSAEQINGSVKVTVSDEGPGIPSTHQDKIFNSFYRIDNRLSRSVQGAGVGLAICQGFVHAHGGEIWLEPAEQGTSITFTLPCVEVTDPNGQQHFGDREAALG